MGTQLAPDRLTCLRFGGFGLQLLQLRRCVPATGGNAERKQSEKWLFLVFVADKGRTHAQRQAFNRTANKPLIKLERFMDQSPAISSQYLELNVSWCRDEMCRIDLDTRSGQFPLDRFGKKRILGTIYKDSQVCRDTSVREFCRLSMWIVISKAYKVAFGADSLFQELLSADRQRD